MPDEHAKQLTAAREKLIAERLKLASSIAEGKVSAYYQQSFITLQEAIDAITRAIEDTEAASAEKIK